MTIELPEIITELKPHSREVRAQAESIRQQVFDNTFLDEAPKREYIEGVTIDSKSSEDIDDLIWGEETKNWYSIIWSIADVTEYIKPYTLIDLDAASRAVTVYDENYDYNMLPREIWIDVCSLEDKLTKKTQSTRINLDKNFEIISYKRFESNSYNMKKFDYEEFNEQYNHYWETYHDRLNLFHKIAKWMYRNRKNKWTDKKYKENISIKLWKESSNNNSIPSFIIREFMLAINIVNARFNSDNEINWINRIHSPIIESSNWTPQKIKAFNSLLSWKHISVWEELYGHFTSPIRRYLDNINHRQQKAKIRKQKEVYSPEEIRKIIVQNNSAIESILITQKNHRHEIWNKKIERYIRDLEHWNFSTLSSVPDKKFSQILDYFIENPIFFCKENILEEIIFRKENKLISDIILKKLYDIANKTEDLYKLRFILKKG